MGVLRQGQTVYAVWAKTSGYEVDEFSVRPFFLHSHRVPRPEPGAVLEKLSVTYARELERSGVDFFQSRRKAARAMRAMM